MTNAARSKNAEVAVYIGLGSNLGDRDANLRQAIEHIAALGLEIRKKSSVYETEPVGFSDQPWFLNQVIEAMTLEGLTSEHGPVLGDPETIATAPVEALLSKLLKIEQEMGRERLVANGPRLIDIDLLLFGEVIIGHSSDDVADNKGGNEGSSKKQASIVVPHPRMHLRRFVLEPMCEIAPDLVHPVVKRTYRDILGYLDDSSMVRWRQK